jgi:hypothetical protein
MTDKMRGFETGATRSSDAGRDDPEGYLSPLVIDRFNQYMTKHRKQADGQLRDSDNWQRGMPLATYMKGMWRHFLHLWTRHRGHPVRDPLAAADIEEDLCAMLFNVQGYLHETLKKRLEGEAYVMLLHPGGSSELFRYDEHDHRFTSEKDRT